MAWCRQVTSHYRRQCSISMSPYIVTKPHSGKNSGLNTLRFIYSQVNASEHIDDRSTMVQVMAWYRQATSHLSQCWPRSMSPYASQGYNELNIMALTLWGLHNKINNSNKHNTFWTRHWYRISFQLQWRHNGHDSISNHQPHHCLLNRYSDADQIKHQSSASLAFVWGIHRSPVNSPHKWPVTRKMFPFDDVIMNGLQ